MTEPETPFDPDDADYPSKAQLETIRTWSTPDYEALLEYVKDAFSTYGRAERKKDGTWEFATGGWSGNEEIIDALSDNGLAWSMLWRSSHRGGLFIFRTPEAESRRAIHVGKARKGR